MASILGPKMKTDDDVTVGREGLPRVGQSKAAQLIYLGPDKTGSTWLYEALKTMPGIAAPKAKELFFFDSNYHLGFDWYAGQFPTADGCWLDVSHDYLAHPLAPLRIKRHHPEAKLVVGLRDPVDRAISAYRFMIFQGRVPKTASIEEAINKHPEIITHGEYSQLLPRWLDVFPLTQLVPFDFAKLRTDPVALIDVTLASVDLERPADCELPDRVNAAKSTALPPSMVRLGRTALSVIRAHGHPAVAGYIKKSTSKILAKGKSQPAGASITSADRELLDECFVSEKAYVDHVFGPGITNGWCAPVAPTT